MSVELPRPARGATLIIRGFVERFNEALKDPQNCRLELSAPNLIVALHREVENWIDRRKSTTESHRKSSLHRTLDTMFLQMWRTNDPGVLLLKRLHESELDVIEQEIRKSSDNLANLSLALNPVVDTIEAPSQAVGIFMAQEVPMLSEAFASGNFTAPMIEAAADLMVRAMLLHDDADNLKRYVKHWLSEGAVDVAILGCEGALVNNSEFGSALQSVAKEVLVKVMGTIPNRDLANRPEDPIGYPQLWQAFRAVNSVRQGEGGVAERLAASLIQTAASRTSFGLFTYFIGENSQELKDLWSAEDHAAAVVASKFVDAGWIRTSGQFHPRGNLIHEALRHWIATAIARRVRDRLLSNSGTTIVELQDWIASTTADLSSQSSQEAFWYLADRNHQLAIINFWNSVRPQVLDAVHAELEAFVEPASTYLSANLRVDDFLFSMRTVSASSDNAWEWLNWDKMEPVELPVALSKLRRAFTELKTFDVVIPLEGSTIHPHTWTTGDLSWYSSATHNLGEPNLIDSVDQKGSNIHVWTREVATSGTSAAEQAILRLEPILSATSFALSSGHGFGYQPGVDSWYMYGDTTSGYSAFRGRRERAESADSRVSPEEMERFGKTYESAFRRASSRNTDSELAVRFKRALFWYRSGRWQKDHTRRLLDHYLALEHFFAAGPRKDEQVANAVGLIEGSWRYRGFPFSVRVQDKIDMADALMKRAQIDDDVAAACELVVREQLSSCRNAGHWRISEDPWLSPSFVGAVQNELKPGAVDSDWSRHLSALASLAEREVTWAMKDERRKESAWFKIRVIAQRRHEIVHDALTHVPGIKYEADALTETVERVLRHFAGHFLVYPEGSTVTDVLDDLTPPWLDE